MESKWAHLEETGKLIYIQCALNVCASADQILSSGVELDLASDRL